MHNTRSKPYNGRLHVTNKKLYTQDKWNLMLLTDMLWITINLYAMDHYYFFMYFQSAFSLVLNSLYIQIWSIGSIHAKAFWFFFMYESHPMQHSSRSWPYSCQSFLIFIDWANPLSYLSIPDWYNQKIGWEVCALEKSMSNLRRDANLPFLISYTRIFVTFCAPYYNC